MQSDKQISTISFGKLFISFLMFLLLILSLISMQTSVRLKEENEKLVEEKLCSELDRVVSRTFTHFYVRNSFKKLIDLAKEKGPEAKELEYLVEDIKLKDKLKVKAFFYKDNILKKSINATKEELGLFSDLLAQLAFERYEEGYRKANRTPHKKLMEYFGTEHRLEIIKHHKSNVTHLRRGGVNQYYHWNTLENGLGVFFLAYEVPSFATRFKNVIKEENKKSFGAISSSGDTLVPPEGFTKDQTLLAYIMTTKTNSYFTSFLDHYWYFQTTRSGEKICNCIPIASASTKGLWNIVNYLQYVSLFFFLLVSYTYLTAFLGYFPGKRVIEYMDSSSIRFRIVGIFSIASFFPVVMTLILGISAVSDKQRVIEKNILTESLANIYSLEDQADVMIEKTEKMSREVREEVKQAALNNRSITAEIFERALVKYNITPILSRIDIRDGSIGTIVTMDDPEINGVAAVFDIICKKVLKEHCPERLELRGSTVSAADLVSESVLSTDELGFATLIRQRDQQWKFNAGFFPTIWYWDVYPDLATGPAFICITNQTIRTFEHHIEDYIYSLPNSSDSILIGAYINSPHNRDKLITPHKALPTEEILNIANTSYYANKIIFRSIDINGHPYWITAKSENKISSHVFMNLISQKERLAILEPFKWNLGFIGLFALTISVFGAWFITNLIILPVGDLSRGILAIRQRKKGLNIPVRRDDEFGKVAVAFNEVINNFEELEYGKIVQESLLPKAAPKINGYDLTYFTIPATDLAGDYHDSALLADGSLAIVLGDVSGHGISASLAMAMAKATFNYAKSIKARFPEELMDMLNTMFNKELKHNNKLMTLVSVLLNPETGEVIFDNAGQSYPVYYSASTKEIEEIKMPSLPLGGMKKRKRKPINRSMEHGDAFILYTDGIIEAAAANGEMFGYERLFDIFKELMQKGTESKEAIYQLFKAMDDFREPGPRSDDITLIILRRL